MQSTVGEECMCEVLVSNPGLYYLRRVRLIADKYLDITSGNGIYTTVFLINWQFHLCIVVIH